MGRSARCGNPVGVALLAAGMILAAMPCLADEPRWPAQISNSVEPGLYLKVRLSSPVKMSKLKPGDVVEGSLSRDVYAADRKLFLAGSRVRLKVDHLERRRRAVNDHWPWVVRVFTPRYESYPVFDTATVSQAAGESSLQASLVSVTRRREVHAEAKKKAGQAPGDEPGSVEMSEARARKAATPTFVLEAFSIGSPTAAEKDEDEETSPETDSPRPEILPAATRCRILLLNSLSASKSKPGDGIQARLLEPVLVNSKVTLPAGSLFEGKVLRTRPPKWLSRGGSLSLSFTALTLPEGNRYPIAASLAGAELDERSHTRINSEGQLLGEGPGKAWMAINLGVSAAVSKGVDDGAQLVIEALVSTATDASTAGTARIVAGCVSGLYMVTRHGRDVVLPRFTEMDISLDRPVSLSSTSGIAASAAAGGGE